MFKHRYGLTWAQVQEGRITANRLCRVCNRLTRRVPIIFNGHRVCAKCAKVLFFLSDQRTKSFVDLVMNQPG